MREMEIAEEGGGLKRGDVDKFVKMVERVCAGGDQLQGQLTEGEAENLKKVVRLCPQGSRIFVADFLRFFVLFFGSR